ncbi:MAG: MFS transporter, partial [Clostridium sp.]
NSVFAMLVWALVTDCLDYQEEITGERADGSVYSLFTFARKLGSTIASTVASYALGWIGYNSALTTQTPEVANRIRVLYTMIPVVTAVLIIIGLGFIFNLKTKEDKEAVEKKAS